MPHETQTHPPVRGSYRPLRVLLLAGSAEQGNVRAALGGVTEPQLDVRESEDGVPAQAAGAPVDVIMFEFDPLAPPQFNNVTGGGEPPVRVALTRERSSQAIREALRAGADEVLFLPLNQEDLSRALLKISETRKLPESTVKAKLISMVSVTGGVGVTTLAANSALALAHSAGKKVALVDLDFQAGDLAVALNVEPESGILDLNDPHMRLNSVQVESALTRHPAGVYLLAAPRRIEEGEQISAAQVGAVLDLMRQMVDFVIVDLGPHIGDTSVVVWDRSDELLYVIDQSIRAMRGAWRFLDLFTRLKLPGVQPRFVLNQWMARHPIGEKHIVNTLGRPLLARIPRDETAMEHALGRGEDLWKAAPRSPLTRAFEALAQQISAPGRRPAKSGLLSKIFARNGAKPGARP